MATHNTGSDAANTAVRAYLTALGEKYLGHGFNTASGKGHEIWIQIKASFDHRCAYCDEASDKLTIEHLVSFNRDTGGLHHPGKVVPCCRACNKRRKVDKNEIDWVTHLADIAERDSLSISSLRERQQKIEQHILDFDHPKLSDDEIAAISTIAKSLYESVSLEVKRGTDLYWSIHQAMIAKSH